MKSRKISKNNAIKLVLLSTVCLIVVVFYLKNRSPSLSSEKKQCYSQFISLPKEHLDWLSFSFWKIGNVQIYTSSLHFSANVLSPSGKQDLEDKLGKGTANEVEYLVRKMSKCSLNHVQKDDEALLFYQDGSWTMPLRNEGYIYSLDKSNLKSSKRGLVAKSTDVTSLGEDWYYSRHLAYGPLHRQ